MRKLKQLQQKQAEQAQQKKDQEEEEETTNGSSTRPASSGRVFTLRQDGRGKRSEKVSAARLRVQKDLGEMEPVPGAEVNFPDSNDLMHFEVKVTPYDGMYTNACFHFNVEVPTNYPYDPPKVVCATPIYHPNIDTEGHVCLNILRAEWMPVLSLGSVVFGLMTLFLEPNPDDPLNKEAAQNMINDPLDFANKVNRTLRGGQVMGRTFPKLI
eukprot:TRINITY_DN15401_c0_g1_i1.p1 TRINITY_DN15401_c0_g1~~TRINITY_DN15401_c0_g1_i1.p1  ORF type:complete len:212 (-),score=34.04 TRINITY_DN15401_c0_g1_i1:172-807(-)